jgi:signal transduction histidine kinase
MMSRLRVWLRDHPLVVDSSCAAALLVVSIPYRAHFGSSSNASLELLLAVAMTAPLAFRRRNPSAVFAVIAFVALLQWLAGVSIRPEDLAILIASYTVAAHGRRWEAFTATAVVLCGVLMAVLRWHLEDVIPAFVALSAAAVAALVLGDDLRNRRAYFAELEERAERLEREREAETRAAVAAERAAIAREMHDIVAHNLSVMVIQADAATYAIETDPARARAVMETVTETGRQALDEMRHLLAVLRPTTAGERAPQPGLAQLSELIDGVRRAGLDVAFEVSGGSGAVGAGVELALYRIVQEALTNTLKHAGHGARARVTVTYGADALTLVVTDDGHGVASRPVVGAGQGIIGMVERATLYGGTLVAEPDPRGGFRVTASFPLAETALPSEPSRAPAPRSDRAPARVGDVRAAVAP